MGGKGRLLGAERWLEVERFKEAASALEYLTNEGYEGVVLEPAGHTLRLADREVTSVPVYELPFERRLALIFGNEKDGVSQELRQIIQHFAHIPMIGFVESLNISVAAAITLFCSMFSQPLSTRRAQAISEVESADLLNRWLREDLRHSEIVLKELEKRGPL